MDRARRRRWRHYLLACQFVGDGAANPVARAQPRRPCSILDALLAHERDTGTQARQPARHVGASDRRGPRQRRAVRRWGWQHTSAARSTPTTIRFRLTPGATSTRERATGDRCGAGAARRGHSAERASGGKARHSQPTAITPSKGTQHAESSSSGGDILGCAGRI